MHRVMSVMTSVFTLCSQQQGFDPNSALARSTQIDMSELMFEKEIGAGSFGTVYKGQWKSWTVAIKQVCFVSLFV